MIGVPRKFDNIPDDDFDTERKFQIDFDEFEIDRMYPLPDTMLMTRAEFIRYKVKRTLHPKPRKES